MLVGLGEVPPDFAVLLPNDYRGQADSRPKTLPGKVQQIAPGSPKADRSLYTTYLTDLTKAMTSPMFGLAIW